MTPKQISLRLQTEVEQAIAWCLNRERVAYTEQLDSLYKRAAIEWKSRDFKRGFAAMGYPKRNATIDAWRYAQALQMMKPGPKVNAISLTFSEAKAVCLGSQAGLNQKYTFQSSGRLLIHSQMAIRGEVQMVGCVDLAEWREMHEVYGPQTEYSAQLSIPWVKGPICWVFTNPVQYQQPIPWAYERLVFTVPAAVVRDKVCD